MIARAPRGAIYIPIRVHPSCPGTQTFMTFSGESNLTLPTALATG
jgi:hypothetical protein